MTDLEKLKRRRARAAEKLERAAGILKAASERVVVVIPKDPGVLSGVAGASYGRRKIAAIEAEAEAYKAWCRASKDYERSDGAYKRAVHDAETRAAVDITAIKPGDLIRTSTWHRVKRLNKKTVTCEPSAPGMDALRYRFDQIREHRPQP